MSQRETCGKNGYECCRHWSLQDGRVIAQQKYGPGETAVECPCACHIEFTAEIRKTDDVEAMEKAAERERKRHSQMAIERRINDDMDRR